MIETAVDSEQAADDPEWKDKFERLFDAILDHRAVDLYHILTANLRVADPSVADRLQVEAHDLAGAVGLGPQDLDRSDIRHTGRALGTRDHLQQCRAALDRLDTRLLHRTNDRHPLAGVLLDEDDDLGVLQIVLGEPRADISRQLLAGQTTRLDHTDQRQADPAG